MVDPNKILTGESTVDEIVNEVTEEVNQSVEETIKKLKEFNKKLLNNPKIIKYKEHIYLFEEGIWKDVKICSE